MQCYSLTTFRDICSWLQTRRVSNKNEKSQKVHCIILKDQFDEFLGKNAHLGSELTKSLSRVRLLGVVGRFRSRASSETQGQLVGAGKV